MFFFESAHLSILLKFACNTIYDTTIHVLTVQAETDIGLTGGVSLGRGLILIRHNTCWFGEKTSVSERRGGVIDERSGHLYTKSKPYYAIYI